MPKDLLRRLTCSPCCLPHWSLDKLLPAYRALGFSRFEAFTEWTAARLDWRQDASIARLPIEKMGFEVTSFHLPAISENDVEGGLRDALVAARYAQELGAGVLLLKAATREVYAQVCERFLNGLEDAGISAVPALQNHAGSAISTLDDYREVFEHVNGDARLKAVLEVGHFQRAGVLWQDAWKLLENRIALIHVNDIKGGKSVPYGSGEVDFRGLLHHVKGSGYAGDIVVELELGNDLTHPCATLDGLCQAVRWLGEIYDSV